VEGSHLNGHSSVSFNQSDISKIYNINLPDPSKKRTRNKNAIQYNSDVVPNATIEEGLDGSHFTV